MRFVCISDTHLNHDIIVPDGDVLLHAGDPTIGGDFVQLTHAAKWIASMPHRYKIVIAGNHDFDLQNAPDLVLRRWPRGVTYLQDSEVTVEGIRIWGSLWQPWFMDMAFNLREGRELAERWALIPPGIDILLTHTPPAGILDRNAKGEPVGCARLSERLETVRPRVHVFGHIHDGYGACQTPETLYINAALESLPQYVRREPIGFDLDVGRQPAKLVILTES
jgi:Icc-related predicted phosphoesterase